ncbi:MAG: Asp-tRNA(Asn)/Glu-tRNA(Gln) amidotransferase subunit GatC [Candidatus Magasanikbacteria bacterium]|nr:Asp-tRNA(Asn)/Glu-tRNA(Gln) amidotransferase subunit GatC [Candidatus Magasanikbacteria bacterium]
MIITKDLIDHLANLARLELTPAEKKKYLKDLSSILDYVNKLGQLGIKGDSSLFNTKTTNVWREDKVEGCTVEERQGIMQSFPDKEGDLLRVKGVFE